MDELDKLMEKKEIILVADYSHQTPLTFVEFCELCHVSREFINELVREGVLSPHGETPQEWVFSLDELPRVLKAYRLKRDLDLDIAGIALVLELLQQIEDLQRKMELVEKHYFTQIKHL